MTGFLRNPAAMLVAGLLLGAGLATAAFEGATQVGQRSHHASANNATPDLGIVDVKIGSGTVAKTGELASIGYTGWLEDGTLVSHADDSNPLEFKLGHGVVIDGLDAGVIGMRVGGIRWLTIPPALAYGQRGDNPSGEPSIPPNTTLVFVVHLVDIKPSL